MRTSSATSMAAPSIPRAVATPAVPCILVPMPPPLERDPASPFDPYTAGLLDGITEYAVQRNGAYYVGVMETPLRTVRRRILDENGYHGYDDPRYAGRPE